MDTMRETLRKDYGVNVNTSAWNKKVTNDWDKAQSLVGHLFSYNSLYGQQYMVCISGRFMYLDACR